MPVSNSHILRLRAIRERIAPPTVTVAGLPAIAFLGDVVEFNKNVRDLASLRCGRKIDQSLLAPLSETPLESVTSVEKYAKSVTRRDLMARIDSVLAALGATSITDEELLRAITDRFSNSYLFFSKRSVIVALVIWLLAFVGINWASVHNALERSNASIAAARAEEAAVQAEQVLARLKAQELSLTAEMSP